MFHHLHDEHHPKRQGSISSDDLERMIDWLRDNYNLISASEYIDRILRGSIARDDVCLSFDDALKCQFDIAVPILRKRNIKAFFFIYSSPFFDQPELLEVFSFFRSTHFNCIDNFYERFFQEFNTEYESQYIQAVQKYDSKQYLSDFGFYSDNDRFFRFLRDKVLSKQEYESINWKLIFDEGFSIAQTMENLWMSENDVRKLDAEGHVIGLHSYSHPTELGQLSRVNQEQEYRKNYNHLSKIIGGKPIQSMSHPCGNYNDQTLSVLNEMNVEIGFRSNIAVQDILSPLEIPREDHSNVMTEIAHANNAIH